MFIAPTELTSVALGHSALRCMKKRGKNEKGKNVAHLKCFLDRFSGTIQLDGVRRPLVVVVLIKMLWSTLFLLLFDFTDGRAENRAGGL